MELLILIFYICAGIFVFIAVGALIAIYKKYQTKTRLRQAFGTLQDLEAKAEDIESIRRSYEALKHDDDLDAITWNDLDLEAFYWNCNSTQSTHGDEWLYARLHRQIPDDTDALDALIQYYDCNEEIRLDAQCQLNIIGKHTDHNTYDFLNKIHTLKGIEPTRFLIQTLLLIISTVVSIFVVPSLILLPFFIFAFNFYTYFEVNPARKYISNVILIASSIKASKKINGNDQVDALVKKLGPISRSINLSTLSTTTNEFGFVLSGLDTAFLITPIFMGRSLKLIQKHKEDILELFEVLGKIDGAIALASFKRTLPYYCEPTFIDDNRLEFDHLTHPLLIHNNGIANNGSTSGRLLFTGSNASGKSTFIKAIALNAHLGQTVNFCTATAFSYKPGYVYTSMALRDSLQSGKSYFIVELESLKRILDATEKHKHCIIVVDEILRGTNTVERIASSTSILESLSSKDALICVATHDIELTELLKASYENYHFREHVEDHGISFDYKLYHGPSRTTNAIKLLDFMHFDAKIVSDSNQRVDAFRTHKSWE